MQDVVGGFVKSYCFNYIPNEGIAQGKMWAEFGNRKEERHVTVVILGVKDQAIGARIIEKTMKICEFSDSVVDVYFTTYCDQINRQIVVYEKFTMFKFVKPSFFEDEKKNKLTPLWVKKIRYCYMLLCKNKLLFTYNLPR